MQPGRKALPPSVKKSRGTLLSKDKNRFEIPVTENAPVMPDFMKLDVDARAVWKEMFPRASAVGVNFIDSEIFARYCVHVSRARTTMRDGGTLTAQMLHVLRQYEELLRMAGPKSRVGVRSLDARKNPFGNNGKRG